jgi:hypothetical protein
MRFPRLTRDFPTGVQSWGGMIERLADDVHRNGPVGATMFSGRSGLAG